MKRLTEETYFKIVKYLKDQCFCYKKETASDYVLNAHYI